MTTDKFTTRDIRAISNEVRNPKSSFEEMPLTDLAQSIRSGTMAPTDLTFAAEHFGQRSTDPATVREVLVPLLSHEQSYVREGALYGIFYHVDSAVAEQLQRMKSADPSNAVRQVAGDVLDNYVERAE